MSHAIIRRPKGMKRPRAGLIDLRLIRVAKRSTIRFVPFGREYPGVAPRPPRDPVDPAFQADVDRLIRENAELLRRLAR